MSDKIKIGSKIIEGGTAYQVFKIENTKNGSETQSIVFYKPCFDNSNSSDIVCSIPEHNINPPDMRRPVSKKEMEEVFIFLSKKTTSNAEVDIMKSKDVFRLNDIFKTAEVLRDVFKEKILKGEEFSKSKRDLMDASVGKMVEEIALVYRVSLEGAKKKLFVALDSSSK